ncbi:ribosome recycling factor [Putridiphycobacter roseus]|uniref:Ribosome-recycling factor n=1 Tax=Putridiphycobacter roseus TaxID=2219161 RepID=A0A2W1MYD6_9FLAO|nr:ribosome recycling factor [Putridiphycobacter roseus]PZE16394.1 ribosome recycling factor [Putridiphycobacter roseus]
MEEEIDFIFDSLNEANNGAIEHLSESLVKIRAGKASPSMVNGVSVDYYGSMTPLSQVANVSTLDARTISVQPWEKAMLDEISRGITNANLGLNPQNNGELIIINVPMLTEERRKDLAKKAKSEGEHAKISLRNNRKDAIDEIKKLKENGLSEDAQKGLEEDVQNITSSFTTKIDELTAKKEADILTI